MRPQASRVIVCRMLHDRGLFEIRSIVCILLTSAHRISIWHRIEIIYYGPGNKWEWGDLIYLRVPFQPKYKSSMYFHLEKTGIRYLLSSFQEKNYYGRGSLMACAGIMFDWRTVFGKGFITGEVLEWYLGILRSSFEICSWPNFILMDYNVRLNRVHLIDEFLERQYVRLMDWPVRSSGQNHIQHIWMLRIGKLELAFQVPEPYGIWKQCC